MTDAQHTKSASRGRNEIWNAIAYFEKILEALPHDRLSLETLANAYEKVGDHTRAKAYTLRLAHVLFEEADEDGIGELRAKIRQFDQDDPEVKAAITSLESLKPAKVMAVVRDDMDQLSRRSTILPVKISMAWNLLQANQLNQEDYAARGARSLGKIRPSPWTVRSPPCMCSRTATTPGSMKFSRFVASSCKPADSFAGQF